MTTLQLEQIITYASRNVSPTDPVRNTLCTYVRDLAYEVYYLRQRTIDIAKWADELRAVAASAGVTLPRVTTPNMGAGSTSPQ